MSESTAPFADTAPSAMIGPHAIWIAAEVLLIRYHGEVTLDHLQAQEMYLERLRAQHGVAVLVGDMSDAGMATPPARRYVAERPPAQPTILFGVGAAQRLLLSLMIRAMVLVGRLPPSFRLVDSEHAALAEVAALRARRILPKPG